MNEFDQTIDKKRRLLKELKQQIFQDSGWLTPTKQWAIERQIDELESFIVQQYKG